MDPIEEIVKRNSYEGIRDQDGWETLELTVRDRWPSIIAERILEWLKSHSA
jgi:hypothetical protein